MKVIKLIREVKIINQKREGNLCYKHKENMHCSKILIFINKAVKEMDFHDLEQPTNEQNN